MNTRDQRLATELPLSKPELVTELARFSRALRAAGIRTSTEQTKTFARSLEIIEPARPRQFRLAARATLVTRRQDLELFDQLFATFWNIGGPPGGRGQKAPRAPRHDVMNTTRPALVNYVAQAASEADRDIDVQDRSGTFADDERFQLKDFSRMTDAERVKLQQAIASMRWQAAMRTTRRRTPDRCGAVLDLRRMLRRAAQQSGACQLAYLRRKVRPRPLVLMADISGSMELYSRLLLQFFHAVTHSFDSVETFAFGSRLTRLTDELKLRNLDEALARASNRVLDWSGGTRIGESLAAFNRHYSRRVLRRGAVVLIVSDGWDCGDVGQLKRQVRALSARSYRMIWLNPLLGKLDYEPRVRGMAAALEHIDDFMPIHNLQSLKSLAQHLTRLPKRKTGMNNENRW